MTSTVLWPDTDTDFRTLLRADTGVMSILSGDTRKLDYEFASPMPATCVSLYRAATGLVPWHTTDRVTYQISCWGKSFILAKRLSEALAQAVHEVHYVIVGSTLFLDTLVLNRYEDPIPAQHRFIVTAQVRSTAAP